MVRFLSSMPITVVIGLISFSSGTTIPPLYASASVLSRVAYGTIEALVVLACVNTEDMTATIGTRDMPSLPQPGTDLVPYSTGYVHPVYRTFRAGVPLDGLP